MYQFIYNNQSELSVIHLTIQLKVLFLRRNSGYDCDMWIGCFLDKKSE